MGGENEGSITGQTWSNCLAGADVFLYAVNGGVHEWPKGVQAAKMIWDLFVQHPFQ